MSTASQVRLDQIILKDHLQNLYNDYSLALDQDDLSQWLTFFANPCLYRIVSRENHELQLPIAVWHSESIGMLRDRVLALRDSTLYRPRYFRHMVSGMKIDRIDGEVIHAQANVLVIETVVDFKTQILLSGRYLDQIVYEDGVYKFKERICVYDSILLPTTLVYPV
jgi:3-phenylpropionate/cinnamic acid dioxygenase small subunit